MSAISALLKLSKIVLLNSAQSPTRTNKLLLFVSLILTTVFIVVSTLRCMSPPDAHPVKKAVSTLHSLCYIFMFFAHVSSNWCNSKKYTRALTRMTLFDHNLSQLGFVTEHKRTKRVFYVSLGASLGVLTYVVVTDVVVDVWLTRSVDIVYWLSIYIPITMNFFCVFTNVFTLFLLSRRFATLKRVSQLNVKKFTQFYLELNEISKLVLTTFSPQIAALHLFIFTTVTSNGYLVFRINFPATQRLMMVNFLLFNCTGLVVVTVAHFWTQQQAEDVVANSPKILTMRAGFEENLECYYLVQDNRFGVKVFGMFSVSLKTLLAVVANVVAYMIILVEFANSGDNARLLNEEGDNKHISRVFETN